MYTAADLGLTEKQVRLIAFELEDLTVSIYDAHSLDELSNRVQDLLHSTGLSPLFVTKQCYFLINKKKIQ